MTQRTGIPGKGFSDTSLRFPPGPGKRTLTSQLDAEIDPPPHNDAPDPHEVPVRKS